jgi:putative membrane protein
MFEPGVFIFGVLIPIAVVALVAYGVWELVRSRDDGTVAVAGVPSGTVPSASARTILDERFARGEVDVDEYVRRRALLDGTVPSPPVDVAAMATPAPADDAAEVGPVAAEAATAEVPATDQPAGEAPSTDRP